MPWSYMCISRSKGVVGVVSLVWVKGATLINFPKTNTVHECWDVLTVNFLVLSLQTVRRHEWSHESTVMSWKWPLNGARSPDARQPDTELINIRVWGTFVVTASMLYANQHIVIRLVSSSSTAAAAAAVCGALCNSRYWSSCASDAKNVGLCSRWLPLSISDWTCTVHTGVKYYDSKHDGRSLQLNGATVCDVIAI